jgi:sugar (pentulose or hexulose) kinase
MTGRLVDTAANNIDLQWPIDRRTGTWSTDPAVYERHGVTPSQLFTLCQPGDTIGPVAAAATGLRVGTPVVATANDKAVERLSVGPLGSATTLVSLGTYICAMTDSTPDGPTGDGSHFWTNPAAQPSATLHESIGVRRGMWTLTWLLDLIGPEFAAAANDRGTTREAMLEAEATPLPAGSDGLLAVLDWLAPTDAAFRKGSLLGFDARHRRGHLYRAIVEAIAVTMYRHAWAMADELGRAIDSVALSGGGSRSELFMQVFADVFGVQVWRSVNDGGAALGAAMCAAVGAGLYPDIPAAMTAMNGPRSVREPNPAHHQLYRQLAHDVHPHVRPATDAIYQRTHLLFS